jgi:PhnB protein
MSIIPNYIPSGFQLINVVLLVKDAQKALDWYNRAFGAEEVLQLNDSDGNIRHAEMKIENTTFMIQEDPLVDSNQSNVIIKLYTPDAEAFMEDAIKEGAMEIQKAKVEFNGDRVGWIQDPFGHKWMIATHIENLTAKEVQKRFHELSA